MSEKMPETWISKMTGPVSALILCIFGINYLATWIDKMSERHFDSIVLSDEAATKQLLIQLADRDIKSQETLLERFRELPGI